MVKVGRDVQGRGVRRGHLGGHPIHHHAERGFDRRLAHRWRRRVQRRNWNVGRRRPRPGHRRRQCRGRLRHCLRRDLHEHQQHRRRTASRDSTARSLAAADQDAGGISSGMNLGTVSVGQQCRRRAPAVLSGLIFSAAKLTGVSVGGSLIGGSNSDAGTMAIAVATWGR